MANVARILQGTGVPGAGTTGVWTLTFGGTPTSGTFKLSANGNTTAAITWSNVNATLVANIDAALEALTLIGTGGVTTAVGTMTAGIGTITLTLAGVWAKRKSPRFVVAENALVGTSPTLAIAETTPGVSPTGFMEREPAMYRNVTTGIVYTNTGTVASPTWTVVGAQT